MEILLKSTSRKKLDLLAALAKEMGVEVTKPTKSNKTTAKKPVKSTKPFPGSAVGDLG